MKHHHVETSASLAIVMPVYEDAEASERLFRELFDQFGRDVFVVAVDDGAIRQPLDIHPMRSAFLEGVVIRLRRNVGHQQAIAVGLHYVADHLSGAQRIVVMDSDGEDLPSSIPHLLSVLERDDIDVVVASRKSRQESLLFKVFYVLYKFLFSLLSGRNINFGNFMALKACALKRISAMQELWVHVAGCVLASKLRLGYLPLDRGPRYAGHSKMNFESLALHGFRGIMVFAERVLVRVGVFCTVIGGLAVLAAVLAIWLKLAGFATPGWFSVALGILMIVFFQTGAITLMTLMLTGVSRSGMVSTVDYRAYIDEVEHV
ncbi:glycosyltransferase [Prosthecochloris sp. N3]|uniref:Glycosyltransferase n=1 Tax=Prosthecochloris ethylica TaxID=2743976 RepID=A0ABR9XRV1_9CHLB|nr:glycosyltransferase [Prosthecochloris ethylica]MBF0586881.1 glycosyltransferase [Prosthecochloris ethylica]MBF0636771.1 glycosyltransferase [Prosthecochloris ethylica]NUK47987.1 glycosyltransferase [Prosthecochloris ethylica]